jgi:hypothetical protein
MATLTISIASMSASRDLSSQDITRLQTALRDRFETGYDDNGDPLSLTNAEVFDLWSDSVFRSLRDLVLRYETRVAAEAASSSIEPIMYS